MAGRNVENIVDGYIAYLECDGLCREALLGHVRLFTPSFACCCDLSPLSRTIPTGNGIQLSTR